MLFKLLILGSLLLFKTANAQEASAPIVEFTEEDGSPSVYPYKVKFANGSVSDNGDGTASISGSPTNVGVGTTNHFIGYTSSNTAGGLQTVEVSGNVGIGTITPTSALTVLGGYTQLGAQSMISQATGTSSSDSDGRATEWYDGLYPTGTGSYKNSATSFYFRKDWGSGNSKTINGFKCYGVLGTPADFVGVAGNPVITFTLYGSNDASSWTSLGSTTANNASTLGGSVVSKLSGLTTTTAYRYHEVRSTWAGPANTMYMDEVQFFESSGSSNSFLGATGFSNGINVAGQINNSSGGIVFPDSTTQTTAATNYWKLSASNVGINTTNNVGIGTTLTTTSALTVMSGNVGIGTWIPSLNLHVNGADGFTIPAGVSISSDGSGTDAAALGFGVSSSSEAQSFKAGMGLLRNQSNGRGYLQFYNHYTSDTNNFTTADLIAQITDKGFHVGTNTAPNGGFRKLTVRADTSGSPILFINGSGSNGIFEIWKDESGAGALPTKAVAFGMSPASTITDDAHISTFDGSSWTGRMTILNSNGNVGIGTNVPATKLQVVGTIRANVEGNAFNNINNGIVVQRTTDDSQFDIGYRTTPDAWLLTATYGTTGAHKPIAFGTSDSERMRIEVNGNVGIGTTLPAFGLDITPDTRIRGNLRLENSKFLSFGSASGEGVTGSQSANSLSLRTNSANRLNIDANGNVGIGTAIPGSLLQVVGGNVGIGTSVATGTEKLLLNTGSGSNPSIGFTASPTTGFSLSGTSIIASNAGTTSTSMTSAGMTSLGYGITNSTSAQGGGLKMASTGLLSWALVNVNDTGFSRTAPDFIAVGNGTQGDISGTLMASNVGLGTTLTTTAALTVMNGNVGIGTWVPAGSLQLSLPSGSSSEGILVVGSTGANLLEFRNLLAPTTLAWSEYLAGAAGNDLSFYDTAARVTFQRGGNVGIGTTNPQAALTVGGGGHFKSNGTAPTVANNDCGTTVQGTVSAGSTDIKGTFTVGTLTVTSCAVTFAAAFGVAPTCITQDDTNVLGTKTTTTTTKMTTASITSMSGDVITYHCWE